MNKMSVAISVCVPMRNAAPYLRACIDSILAQTFGNFELLIVDDGSTDNSADIVATYADERIRLIKQRHDFIGALNLLLQEARGRYIARMDADDVMLPRRLEWQYTYMEQHPEVDMVCGGLLVHDEEAPDWADAPRSAAILLPQMLDSCCVAHPTVMLRTSTVRHYHLAYERQYIYAEDYRLWMHMLQLDLQLRRLEVPLVWYRLSDGQISSRHAKRQAATLRRIQREMREWQIQKEHEVAAEEYHFPVSGNELTLVIPFINEGAEVANTVRSARDFVGNAVDIIVVDDHSYDGYDYRSDLSGFNVRYVYNQINIGAAASKEKGARLSTTPYFILLDAHMRFYDGRWLERYLSVLKEDDRRIVCCQTRWLSMKDGVLDSGGKANTCGAFLRFDEGIDVLPGIQWRSFRQHCLQGNQIPAVLGATYGASKRYWALLKGFQGLIHYGCEEAYISIKAWLEGGGCFFIDDVTIGHIYRSSSPFVHRTAESFYNNVLIMHTLFPTSLKYYGLERMAAAYPVLCREINALMACRAEEWSGLRAYYRATFREPFSTVMEMNELLPSERYDYVSDDLKLLNDITTFLANGRPDGADCGENPGFCQGLMGRVFYLCLYASVLRQPRFDDMATELFERVTTQLERVCDATFQDGLSGIGWALIYLRTRHLVDEVDDLLATIDLRIMDRDVRRIADTSLATGLGGILAYVVTRLGDCRRCQTAHHFDQTYLRELQRKSRALLRTEKDHRSRSYAHQFLAVSDDDWSILRPELWEVLSFPEAINQNQMHWRPTMNNCLGYGIKLLMEMKKINQIKRDMP